MSIFPIEIYTEIFAKIIDDIIFNFDKKFNPEEGVAHQRKLIKLMIKTDLLPLLHSSSETRKAFRLLVNINSKKNKFVSNYFQTLTVKRNTNVIVFGGFNFDISFLYKIEEFPILNDYFIIIKFYNRFRSTNTIINNNSFRLAIIEDSQGLINSVFLYYRGDEKTSYDFNISKEQKIIEFNEKYSINNITKKHKTFLDQIVKKHHSSYHNYIEIKKHINLFLFGRDQPQTTS